MKELAIANARDIVDVLKQHHAEAKALLSTILTSHGRERKTAFTELRRLVAIHEAAEEAIVHSAIRGSGSAGEMMAGERLREELEIKKEFAAAEAMDCDSREFEVAVRALQSAIVAHTEAEEAYEFPRLSADFNDAQLHRMRKALRLAASSVPARDPSGAEPSAGNVIFGPIASLVDRMRDAR